MDHRRLGNLRADTHHRIELRHRVLEDHGDLAPTNVLQRLRTPRQQIHAIEQHSARQIRHQRRSADEPEQAPGEHRLAAATFPDERQHLTASGTASVMTGRAIDRRWPMGSLKKSDGGVSHNSDRTRLAAARSTGQFADRSPQMPKRRCFGHVDQVEGLGAALPGVDNLLQKRRCRRCHELLLRAPTKAHSAEQQACQTPAGQYQRHHRMLP